MRRTRGSCIAAILFLGAMGGVVGCGGHSCPGPFPSIDAVAAGRAAVKEYDTNGDGRIAGAELDRCPGVKAAIDQIDPSGNREVTSEMITARIEAWRKSRLGAMSVTCRVTHDGRPLPDAEVKFVPEKFLGPNVPTASGTTDKDGVAIVSISGSVGKPLGVAPGFYRVEITKRGVKIPAECNMKTTLGLEIALDADWITKCGAKPLEFDLKY